MTFQITEAATLNSTSKSGRKWRVTLLREGVSLNRRYYSGDLIKNSAQLFEGKWANVDHPTAASRADRPEGSIAARAGWYSNVKPVLASDGKWQLDADFHVALPWVREAMLNAWEMGRPDWAGFSINATATSISPLMIQGETVSAIEGLRSVDSVDLVTVPGAGGAVRQLLESHGGNMPPDGTNDTTGSIDVAEVARLAAAEATRQTTEAFQHFLTEALAEDDGEYEDEEYEDEEYEDDDEEYEDDDEEYEDDGDDEFVAEVQEAFAGVSEQLADVQRELYLTRGRELIDVALNEAAGLSPDFKASAHSELTRLLEVGALRSEDVARVIETTRDLAARVAPGVPSGTPYINGVQAPTDSYYKSLQATFDGAPVDGNKPFRSIKEAYLNFPGNQDLAWLDVSPLDIFSEMRVPYDSQRDSMRIKESVSTATFGNLWADVLYNRMMKAFADLPYSDWRRFVTEVESVPDFQTRNWTRWGSYENIPSVAEGAPYQPLTTPTDQKAHYSIAKYGGLEEVTLESIANDYLGQLRQIPRKMAYASLRTFYESVMDAITVDGLTGTTSYDAYSLYSATHGNLTSDSSIILTPDGLNTIQIAMRLQRPYGAPTTEFLGPRAKIKNLIIPPSYEQRVNAMLSPTAISAQLTAAPSGGIIPGLGGYTGIDPHAFASSGIVPTVYDKLSLETDPTWFATADPQLIDMLIVGFLNGRDTPDLFVQDQSVMAGSAFSADKITYKVRWFWGVLPLEHRGIYAVVEG